MKRSHCIGMMAATLLASYRNDERGDVTAATAVEAAEELLMLAELAELNRAKPPGVARPRGEMVPYRPGDAV